MLLAHLADLHLGRRQFDRDTPAGFNQREEDGAIAFRNAVDAVILAKPDLIVVAGDIFHSALPRNHALLFAYRQFRRLRLALPNSPVIVVSGNHDDPNSVALGSPLSIFAELGCEVVLESKWLRYPELDLAVLAVSERAVDRKEHPDLAPDGSAKHQVLLLHGNVPAITSPWMRKDPLAEGLTPEQLSRGWDYVALGHFHCQVEVAPACWYAGSIDYSSTDNWKDYRFEQQHEITKGWILVDLEAGTVERKPLPIVRPHIDLPAIDADGLTPEEIDARIQSNAPADVTGMVLRQVITNLPLITAHSLNHAAIRKLQGQALWYQLDTSRAELPVRIGGVIVVDGEPVGEPVEECWDLSEFGLDNGKEPIGGWPGSGEYSIADGHTPLGLVMEGEMDDYCGGSRMLVELSEGESFDLPARTAVVSEVAA